MTSPKHPECALCGLDLQNWTPVIWADGEPYCGDECARLARALEDAP